MHLRRLACLPDVALERLGLLFKQSIATLKVPIQELLNILTLLGKKSGGSRTIAIMASFYRALMKFFCPEIRAWDAEAASFWDSALAGSSSLQAAVARALKIENGCARGAWVGHELWDMRKFYDSIRLPILCEELSKLNFPKPLMVIGFLVHAAPRILRVGTSFGPIIHSCKNSILAGCQLSCSFARGLLRELMQKLSVVDPEHPCAQHLDDMSHVLIGETESELKHKLVKAGTIVGQEVKRLSLTLADKSTLLPKTKMTEAVAEILNAQGILIRTAETCDDVGVQMTASTVRRASTLNARIAKGSLRGKRTKALVAVNPEAKKLTVVGTCAVQPYGHQAQGASLTQQLSMRKNVKSTTPFAGSSACTTTVIGWTYGANVDPLIKIPLEQIDMWLQLWAGTTRTERHDTRFTWQKHLNKYIGSGCKPLSTMGPAGATINAVLQAGWRPARPDLWHHVDGLSLHLDGKPFTRFRTIAAAHEALQSQAWKRASKNEHGAGLETGIPSFAAARRATKYLHKHGFHKQAKALEFVLVGFFRDPEPDEPGHKAWCKRCGKKARATRRHTVYECPDNENISEEIFRRTNAVLKEATEEHFVLYSVLWFRGIIP